MVSPTWAVVTLVPLSTLSAGVGGNTTNVAPWAVTSSPTGGLAVTVSMPADARMIITRVTLEFLKKARGRLTSEGTCAVPESNQRAEVEVQVAIRDASGDVVAQGTVHVLVGPIRKK